MTPAASIVVPLLSQPVAWLEQCLRSALSQTVVSEVIVVLSPRTPAELVLLLHDVGKRAARLSVLPEEGEGFAAALNTGIRASTATRIGFLLADDWLEPDAVEVCLRHDSDIVSTGMRFWDEDGRSGFRSIDRRPTQAIFDALPTVERKASYLEHFFVFRRQALLAVGGVDESIGLTGADDYDLIWTMLENGAQVTVIPDQVYNYRDHFDERLTLRQPELQLRDLAKVLEKHGLQGEARHRVLREHSNWFGAPVHVVHERLLAARRQVTA